MAYSHKWSLISYKSNAGQRKHIGQRPMLYRWTTPPNLRPICCGQMACMDQDATWHGAGGGPGPGDFVLDGDPVGALRPNGWMDQDETWHACRPRPRTQFSAHFYCGLGPGDFVLDGDPVGALWPNGWMDQDETWHACRPRPRTHCVRWKPSSPSPKGHSPPIFGPYVVAKWHAWIKMPLGMELEEAPAQATLC